MSLSDADRWLSVAMIKPRCPREKSALGTPVLVWPRRLTDGFAYYGKRATGFPTFYLHGAEIIGITHWQPMPKGPKNAK